MNRVKRRIAAYVVAGVLGVSAIGIAAATSRDSLGESCSIRVFASASTATIGANTSPEAAPYYNDGYVYVQALGNITGNGAWQEGWRQGLEWVVYADPITGVYQARSEHGYNSLTKMLYADYT